MSVNLKLEQLLAKLLTEKQKLFDAKAILKGYKITSKELTELKRAKKDLQDQLNMEKERIEAEFMEDEDYVKAKESESEHKERMKELAAELREAFAEVAKHDIEKFEYLIEGEQQQVQIERKLNMYINGKKES